ncbi:MAG: hypothetical protein LBU31_01360 [Coriobacteriales bacterium]|jgi:hypothetical protein|nr:hypothetical protein [Coriobacteriales bacterium]
MNVKNRGFSFSFYRLHTSWARLAGPRLLAMLLALLLIAAMLPGLTLVADADELGDDGHSYISDASARVGDVSFTRTDAVAIYEPGTGSGTGSGTALSQVAPIVSAAREQGVTELTLLGQPVPLVSPLGHGAWSLFNLICTIAGILVLAFVGVYLLIPLRSKQEGGVKAAEVVRFDWDGNQLVGDAGQACREARPEFLVATAFATAAGVVLFMSTNDITLPMVMFNVWGIAFGILLLAAIICARLAFIRPRKPYGLFQNPLLPPSRRHPTSFSGDI